MSLRINSLLLSIRSVWEFKTIQLYKWWLGISGLILKFCCVVEKHKFIANFAFSHLLMSMKIYRNLVKLSGKFVQFSLTAFDIGGNRSCNDAFLKSSICWCEQSQLMAFSHNERKKIYNYKSVQSRASVSFFFREDLFQFMLSTISRQSN